MLCCSIHCETHNALSSTQSSADFCSICFEDTEVVLAIKHAIDLGSSEAYRGRVIDRSHSQAATSADSTLVQDGFALCIPSRAWTRDRSLHHFEACHPGSDRPGFGALGSAECNHKPITCPHYTCGPPTGR